LAMLATTIFDHLFIKSNISAMDRLVVVKFHINIANRWLFMKYNYDRTKPAKMAFRGYLIISIEG